MTPALRAGPLRALWLAAGVSALGCTSDLDVFDALTTAAGSGLSGSTNDSTTSSPSAPAATSAVDGTGGASGRVEGPIVLYTFEESEGDVVFDRSMVDPPLDLQIEDPSATAWQREALEVIDATRISQADAAGSDKLASACEASGEFTVEAWIAPQSGSWTVGPRRIITLSTDFPDATLTLAQGAHSVGTDDRAIYVARVRTDQDPAGAMSSNGNWEYASADGTAEARLTHLVITGRADEALTIFVDTQPILTGPLLGSFATWDPLHRLSLAGEFDDDVPPEREFPRFWLGTFHLVAIYDRALSDEELDQNFRAGPDPGVAQ